VELVFVSFSAKRVDLLGDRFLGGPRPRVGEAESILPVIVASARRIFVAVTVLPLTLCASFRDGRPHGGEGDARDVARAACTASTQALISEGEGIVVGCTSESKLSNRQDDVECAWVRVVVVDATG
jgi:hypothetical protein